MFPAIAGGPHCDQSHGAEIAMLGDVRISPGKRAKKIPNAPTVLVVDDEDLVRKLLSGALQKAGFQVLEASSGYSAMTIADNYPNEIDVLLTDVVMPGMPGPELALTLRGSRPNLRIVLMSGTPNTVDGHGFPLIQKPFRPSDVIGKLRDELQSDTS